MLAASLIAARRSLAAPPAARRVPTRANSADAAALAVQNAVATRVPGVGAGAAAATTAAAAAAKAWGPLPPLPPAAPSEARLQLEMETNSLDSLDLPLLPPKQAEYSPGLTSDKLPASTDEYLSQVPRYRPLNTWIDVENFDKSTLIKREPPIRDINASIRVQTGSRFNGALRSKGLIPGVLQGKQLPDVLISVRQSEIVSFMDRGGFFGRIYNLVIAGQKHLVRGQQLGRHRTTDLPMRVSFARLIGPPNQRTVREFRRAHGIGNAKPERPPKPHTPSKRFKLVREFRKALGIAQQPPPPRE